MPGSVSKVITDLNSVPKIIGALGINIAEAQKALNLDYLESLERLLGLIEAYLHPRDEAGEPIAITEAQQAVITELLQQLAPSRYQFTETTLAVKLNLAQTVDIGANVGFSAGVGAVAVNAAMTVGFGFDYEAAAEVRTTLHAVPASEKTLGALLNRAADANDKLLAIPAGAEVDQQLINKSHSIVDKLLEGAGVQPPETKE